MDSTTFQTICQPILESIEGVSRNTETVYLGMGDTYPVLIRELDASLGDNPSGQGSAAAQAALAAIINDTLRIIGEHQEHFSRSHLAIKSMLDALDQELRELEKLDQSVLEIREDSILMEVASLNAMVIAIKAGEAGRAFSCITTELKQLSNQTMDLTDQISRGAQTLTAYFKELKAALQVMIAAETADFAGFLETVRQLFEGMDAGSLELLRGIRTLQAQSELIKQPLVKIMVEIQNQDRIRQSIDHVRHSLQEFQAEQTNAQPVEQLEELFFLENLPELSSMVLDEISSQISQNRVTFHDCLGQALAKINDLEAQRQEFLTNQLASRRDGSFEALFNQGESVIFGFLSATEQQMHDRERTFRHTGNLRENVKYLVGLLQAFDFILSKFRNINLASQIQVARQSALYTMRVNTAEMGDLTQKIALDVGAAMSITNQFSATVDTIFKNYHDQSSLRLAQDQAFHDLLRSTLETMRGSKEVLGRSILDSRIFSQKFMEKFSVTETDLLTLDRLLVEIQDQKPGLARIKDRIASEKMALIERFGLQGWKPEQAKLKAMVERFTIFTHKKFAAELGDFEVATSVDSGEVTLF